MEEKNLIVSDVMQLMEPRTRRQFLKLMGVGGTVVLMPSVFTACHNDKSTGPGGSSGVALDLSNDAGILNYAYALEQLEAAFYTQVVASFSGSNLSAAEQGVLSDIKNHEVIHREAFKVLLGNAKIGDLTPNFSAINFSQRTTSTGVGVLQVAKTFEDLGVSAYNGAGKYLTDVQNLLVAGKIVSVEARHASAIRDLLNPGSKDFAGDDVVDANGLDVVNEPSAVLAAAKPFITTNVTISKPPV